MLQKRNSPRKRKVFVTFAGDIDIVPTHSGVLITQSEQIKKFAHKRTVPSLPKTFDDLAKQNIEDSAWTISH